VTAHAFVIMHREILTLHRFLMVAGVLFAIGHMVTAQTTPPADEAAWLQLTQAGIQLSHAGNYAAAEPKFRRALLEAEAFGGADHRLWASLSNLAYVSGELGDLSIAATLYRRRLELCEKQLGEESFELTATLNNLAGIVRLQGRYSEADALARRALGLSEKTSDVHLTAVILNTLGLTLCDLKENARAEPVLRRSRALFEQSVGVDSIEAGKVATNLANLYRENHELTKAEKEQRRGLEILEKRVGGEHPLLVSSLNNMFTILALQDRVEEGAPFLERALEIAGRAIPKSATFLQMRANLATLEARRGHYAESARILEEVIARQEALLGSEHPQLAVSLGNYSEVLRKLHQNDQAKRAQARANAILKAFR
jgi:tetratricopeptide (TPR) repeat protein